MIQPGATIGILGGGQLGRMLIIAGRPLGYRFHVFDPKGPSTAGRVADLEINADILIPKHSLPSLKGLISSPSNLRISPPRQSKPCKP